jgi:hypothetical protein
MYRHCLADQRRAFQAVLLREEIAGDVDSKRRESERGFAYDR